MELRKCSGTDHVGKLGLLGKIMGKSHNLLVYCHTSHQNGFTQIGIDQKHRFAALSKRGSKIKCHTALSLIRSTAGKCDHFLIRSTELDICSQSFISLIHLVIRLPVAQFNFNHNSFSPLPLCSI